MKIPISKEISEKISARAAQLAREDIRNMGWSDKSIQGVTPLPNEGTVGLGISQKYLIPQSRGFKPFLMTWVEGRTVPLHDKASGETHYRVGSGVGQPGWVTLPGGVRKWREKKWQHPGLKPKRFLENAISRAIDENKPLIQQQIRKALKGG